MLVDDLKELGHIIQTSQGLNKCEAFGLLTLARTLVDRAEGAENEAEQWRQMAVEYLGNWNETRSQAEKTEVAYKGMVEQYEELLREWETAEAEVKRLRRGLMGAAMFLKPPKRAGAGCPPGNPERTTKRRK